MSQKKLRVTIDPKGSTKVEAVGFAGVGCTTAVDNFVAGMGAVPVVEPELTEDYFAAGTEQELEGGA